jgi:PTS system fructose-specific IIC component
MEEDYGSMLKNARAYLMTGVSYMIPVVVGGGLCRAASYLLGGGPKHVGTIPAALWNIGTVGISLYTVMMATFIAYGIAGRFAIGPAIIGGTMAATLGTGFLGAIAVGFLVGFGAHFLQNRVISKLPANARGMATMSYGPFIMTAIIGLLMLFVFGPVFSGIMNTIKAWITNINTSQARWLIGLVTGLMEGTDYGGPISSASAYSAIALYAEGIVGPRGAVITETLIPSVGVGLATLLAPHLYSKVDKENGKAALTMGLSGGLIEGAIPFALTDPLSVVPATMLGCAISGTIASWQGMEGPSPAGIFTPFIVNKPLVWIVAAVLGIVVTAVVMNTLKTIRHVKPAEDEA